jgi:hypothetical protein
MSEWLQIGDSFRVNGDKGRAMQAYYNGLTEYSDARCMRAFHKFMVKYRGFYCSMSTELDQFILIYLMVLRNDYPFTNYRESDIFSHTSPSYFQYIYLYCCVIQIRKLNVTQLFRVAFELRNAHACNLAGRLLYNGYMSNSWSIQQGISTTVEICGDIFITQLAGRRYLSVGVDKKRTKELAIYCFYRSVQYGYAPSRFYLDRLRKRGTPPMWRPTILAHCLVNDKQHHRIMQWLMIAKHRIRIPRGVAHMVIEYM